MQSAKKHWIFFLTAASSLAADLFSKYLVFRLLPAFGDRARVIPGFFDLVHSENRGGVFGLFPGWGGLLLPINVVAIAFIFYMQFGGMKPSKLGSFSLGLIFGGALGNVFDRLFYGFVRDFIDWHVGSHAWPTFNLADAFLCVGAGLLVIQMAREEKAKKASPVSQ